MRRSVTAAGAESARLDAIAASPETPENVTHACIETNAAENEKEERFGVEPAVEKKAEKAADNDGGNEYEGQLHGDRSLVRDIFCFLRGG